MKFVPREPVFIQSLDGELVLGYAFFKDRSYVAVYAPHNRYLNPQMTNTGIKKSGFENLGQAIAWLETLDAPKRIEEEFPGCFFAKLYAHGIEYKEVVLIEPIFFDGYCAGRWMFVARRGRAERLFLSDHEYAAVATQNGHLLGFIREFRRRYYVRFAGMNRDEIFALPKGGARANFSASLNRLIKNEKITKSAHEILAWEANKDERFYIFEKLLKQLSRDEKTGRNPK